MPPCTAPLSVIVALMLIHPLSVPAADEGPNEAIAWPVAAPYQGGELRLYHPHAESLVGDRLTARAAFSITTSAQAQPAFGVAWLAARADIDREDRTVALSGQAATRVHLPDAGDAEEAAIAGAITGLVQERHPVLSLDRILTALAETERERQSAAGLATTPPKIIVVWHPAVLLYVDGEPQGAPLPGTRFERIQNTPYLLARDQAAGTYWLLYGGRWYRAPVITGPWGVTDQPGDEVKALAPLLGGAVDQAPSAAPVEVAVSLEPAELVSGDGPPAYEPIRDTSLLVVANTDSDLFLDTATRQHYLLLGGRWYRTADLARGPWVYVPPSALLRDFARIPPDSPHGAVLAHVAGTTAAEEAALDAQVPQTAAVKRDATIAVSYAGSPQWQPIPGTTMSYAVNSEQEVIEVADGDYYCCLQGVWYRASSPAGPWTVAASPPPGIGGIPPDHPLYHVRYVYVYETTPDYVYVGYSPGYLGCYVFNGCVVWGTGYHYRCWWDHRYFPRPVTWGFGMAYDPWAGHWGVCHRHGVVGRDGGFGVVGRRDGWWGPAGYRPVIAHHRFPDQRMADDRQPPHPAAARDQGWSANLYLRPGNRERVVPATVSHPPSRADAARGPHDAHAADRIQPSRDGEVFRRDGDGWQRWQRDGWQRVPGEATSRPGTTHPAPSPPADNRPPSRPGVVAPAPVRPPVEEHPMPPSRPGAAAPTPVRPPIEEHPLPPPRPGAVAPAPVRPPPPPPPREEPRSLPPPARIEQLERQQRAEDRGLQRSQQFQRYRAEPADDQAAPAAGPRRR